MAKTNKFQVKYSTKGITGILKRLDKYDVETLNFQDSLDEIGQRYTKIAQDNLKERFHTQKQGDLLASEIHYKKEKNSVTIIAGMFPDYILSLYYAEFGAGMVSWQHPLANEFGWEYDVKHHGEKGWFYYTTENDKGWQYGDVDGERHYQLIETDSKYKIKAWVKSSEPTLFMYNTYRQILADGFIAQLIKDKLEKIKYGKDK